MSEVVTTFLTEEELKAIQNIRSQYNSIALALGEAELKKELLLNSHKNLTTQEQGLYDALTQKYGNASINLATGELTPTSE